MTFSRSCPQPSAEDIARVILQFAKRRYFIRTFERDEPLFKCALVMPKLGKHVHVELLPSLALRVRDRVTGEVLAQSMPGDFDTLDVGAPAIEKMFLNWQANRETCPVVVTPTQPGGDE
ncbi:hypothetical protein F3K02_04095 [Hydrogenophaga sp. D2P1]|uniref:Uncharacterized protein n=1 Tax=Hydrogenophaga aromaticivorans TaxID=2610898 RepID=A0A7Y8GT90_9BURK|nr:hypothetical protein [Hydrogenophaga aromaticivorans]NWF44436.1 hypothetical protein [Hydrogenophaga aromaticivorans]